MNGSDTLFVLEVFVLLVAAAAVVAVLTRRMTILPYSVALVLLGLAVSALDLPIDLDIAPELLLAVLIPGLVFEAAYRIDLRDLVPNLASIVLLATVGVILTAGAVAFTLETVGLPFTVAFLVGTMLAATDPAAVVAIFGKVRAPRRLTTLVEAESLFNDGTGVVIFSIAVSALSHPIGPEGIVGGVIVTAAVSTAIGVALGLVASRVMGRIDDHLVELTISLVAAYGSYLLAHQVGQSGILATVACGLVFGSLGRRAASARAEDSIDTVWEFIAFLMTTLVFLLVGLAISLPQLAAAAGPILLAVVALVVSRGLIVYGLLGLGSRAVARFGWGRPITWTWLHLLAWAGLRGAIAIALALSLPQKTPDRALLQGIVFGCVLVTLLAQGTTAGILIRVLGIETHEEAPPDGSERGLEPG